MPISNLLYYSESIKLSITFNHFCFQSAAKFDLGRAQVSLDWIEAVTGKNLEYPEGGSEIRDQKDFGTILQNGHLLCE